MKRYVLIAAVLGAVAAGAGTRYVETYGTLPTVLADGGTTDGLSLAEVTACRATVRFIDGGTVAGGKLVPYYYDSAIAQWLESKTSDQCTLATDTQVDGGARRAQICEWAVQAQYGRVSVVPLSLTPQTQGIIRLECSGPGLNGGTR